MPAATVEEIAAQLEHFGVLDPLRAVRLPATWLTVGDTDEMLEPLLAPCAIWCTYSTKEATYPFRDIIGLRGIYLRAHGSTLHISCAISANAFAMETTAAPQPAL